MHNARKNHGAYLSPNAPYDVFSDTEYNSLIRTHLNTIQTLEGEYYASESTPTRQRQIRDQISDIMQTDINELWRRFYSSFYGHEGLVKFGTETASGAFSAAAAITSPSRSTQILSTAAASILAIGGALEKDLLQNVGADVLLGQMEADRQQLSSSIAQKLTGSVTDYPLVNLNSDLSDYSLVLSVLHALLSIRAKTGVEATEALSAKFPTPLRSSNTPKPKGNANADQPVQPQKPTDASAPPPGHQ